MDLADKAEILVVKEIDTMIAVISARLKGHNQSGLCLDCSEAIPANRRAILPGCARCADCQADFEGI